MKALTKDYWKGMRAHRGKIVSVFFIILLGAAFFSGLRTSERDMLLSAEAYYDEYALMDLRVVSTAGLTEADVSDVAALEGVCLAEGGYTADALSDDEDRRAVRILSYSEDVNRPKITSGRAPQAEGECLLDSLLKVYGSYEIGDTISFTGGDGGAAEGLSVSSFTVVGFADLPQYMDIDRGTGTVGNGKTEGFVIVSPEAFSLPYYTELRVLVRGAAEEDSFDEAYAALVEGAESEIEAIASSACERRYEELKAQASVLPFPVEIPQPQWYVLGRDTIVSCVNFENDAARIGSLDELLPVIFFLVAALVSLTAMTRLVEEERLSVGTLKALGCGDGYIFLRYLSYAILPTLLGSVVGVLIGEKVFPLAIVSTYSMLYQGLTEYVVPYHLFEGLAAIVASVLCTGLATASACARISLESPAQLMRPVAPKPGKRVLAERISFFWKRLSFTQKATVRNMFRYKKRFLMTVIGVAGCMGLVLVGFGLHDSIMVVADKQFTEITHYQAAVTLADGVSEEQTEALLSSLCERDGVSALPLYQKTVEAEGEDGVQTLTVCVPQDMSDIADYFTFRDRTSQRAIESGGVLLSEKTAASLKAEAGEEVILRIDNVPTAIVVDDIFENYIGHYLFIPAQRWEERFGKVRCNQILLRYDEADEELQDELGSFLLQQSAVQGVTFVSTTVDWANDTLASLNTIVMIVLGTAALLAFVVLYNLNSINIAERKRELATLKVLGFYDPEVAAYVYKENILLTAIGVVFGIAVGIFLHQYVIRSIEVDLIMFGRSIAPLSYLLGAALTMFFSAFINLAMYRSLKKIDMIESLKNVE